MARRWWRFGRRRQRRRGRRLAGRQGPAVGPGSGRQACRRDGVGGGGGGPDGVRVLAGSEGVVELATRTAATGEEDDGAQGISAGGARG